MFSLPQGQARFSRRDDDTGRNKGVIWQGKILKNEAEAPRKTVEILAYRIDWPGLKALAYGRRGENCGIQSTVQQSNVAACP